MSGYGSETLTGSAGAERLLKPRPAHPERTGSGSPDPLVLSLSKDAAPRRRTQRPNATRSAGIDQLAIAIAATSVMRTQVTEAATAGNRLPMAGADNQIDVLIV